MIFLKLQTPLCSFQMCLWFALVNCLQRVILVSPLVQWTIAYSYSLICPISMAVPAQIFSVLLICFTDRSYFQLCYYKFLTIFLRTSPKLLSASWSVNSRMNLARSIWMSEDISYDPAEIWWRDGIKLLLKSKIFHGN